MANLTKVVGIRLTEDEHDRLSRVAIAKGIPPSSMAAQLVRTALPVFKDTDSFEAYLVREGLARDEATAANITKLAKEILGGEKFH